LSSGTVSAVPNAAEGILPHLQGYISVGLGLAILRHIRKTLS